MEDRHVQMVMAADGYYKGGIDGIVGPQTLAAAAVVEADLAALYTFDPKTTFENRRLVGAAQACLSKMGFDPGEVDGWYGHNTEEALNAFLYKEVNGKPEVIARDALPTQPKPASGDIPRQKDVASYYGKPGAQIRSRLVMIQLPFRLRIDWNLRKSTNKIRVHEKAAAQLERALIEVRDHYGADRMAELGIDRYAGAYNHRKMRGGDKWSMHAYGCAIDFYAGKNGLRTRCPQALFCGPEYQAFLDIMERNEWLPALRLWGADGMHFQRARL